VRDAPRSEMRPPCSHSGQERSGTSTAPMICSLLPRPTTQTSAGAGQQGLGVIYGNPSLSEGLGEDCKVARFDLYLCAQDGKWDHVAPCGKQRTRQRTDACQHHQPERSVRHR
jgi:hypothetical protein